MRLHGALDDRQPQARPAYAPGDERIEQALFELLGHAGAIVAHGQQHGLVQRHAVGHLLGRGAAHGHHHARAGAGRLDAIEYEVHHHPVQQILIPLDQQRLPRNGNVRARRTVRMAPHHVGSRARYR